MNSSYCKNPGLSGLQISGDQRELAGTRNNLGLASSKGEWRGVTWAQTTGRDWSQKVWKRRAVVLSAPLSPLSSLLSAGFQHGSSLDCVREVPRQAGCRACWKPRGRAQLGVMCLSLDPAVEVVLEDSSGRWQLPFEAHDESRGRAFPKAREARSRQMT